MSAISSETLWHELNTDLMRFIRRRVSSEANAEDILQDVFLKIHRNLDQLGDDERVAPWVYRIARNQITDHYRNRDKDARLNEKVPIPEPHEDQLVISANQAVGSWLRLSIDRLDEPYREAVRLVELEGVSQRQAADQLGLSVSGAKSRVQRGRAHLRKMLHRCCEIERDRRGNVIDYERRKGTCC